MYRNLEQIYMNRDNVKKVKHYYQDLKMLLLTFLEVRLSSCFSIEKFSKKIQNESFRFFISFENIFEE